MHLRPFAPLGCASPSHAGVEQGLAEAEEELALALAPGSPGEVVPPHLPRAELGRNWPGRVNLGICFFPTRTVRWPQDKLQPGCISARINWSYIKANSKPSLNLQALPWEEVPRLV